MEINKEILKRIDKYVQAGRFKTADDFVEKAIALLLYAEDNRDAFKQVIRKG